MRVWGVKVQHPGDIYYYNEHNNNNNNNNNNHYYYNTNSLGLRDFFEVGGGWRGEEVLMWLIVKRFRAGGLIGQ
jgi:hypothetical protein